MQKATIIIVAVVVAIVAALVGAVFLSNNQVSANGKLEISEPNYIFADAKLDGGTVSHEFEIKNTSDTDLDISNIKSSCMCTTAKLRVGDQESKEFGMHPSSIPWSQKIGAGQSGYLVVTFDPAVHGEQGLGQNDRFIEFKTSDKDNRTAKVSFSINVIK